MARTLDFVLKRHVLWLYVSAFVLFVIVKGGLRRLAAGREVPGWIEVTLYSFPNTAEAVIGMTTVVGLLFVARSAARPRFDGVPDRGLYALGAILTGLYVISQELKLHHIGGDNVYDPYDVAASVVGLGITLAVFWRVGFARPRAAP